MHGKLYKISEDSSSGQATKVEIYASFGGLLVFLKGDPWSAANLELDQRPFLLIRKVQMTSASSPFVGAKIYLLRGKSPTLLVHQGYTEPPFNANYPPLECTLLFWW
uniref:Uncharacterized protein n=2 Tax=Triticum urartu TaxID=4572 RepID=A0A8R7R6I9_TRIUA